jgi:hypothetical protein
MLGGGADGDRHAVLHSAAAAVRAAATCTTLHVGHVPLMISPVVDSRDQHTHTYTHV